MKNYLLTDFNSDRWTGINLDIVDSQLNELNERIRIIGIIYGEVLNRKPKDFDVNFSNVSHTIERLTLLDGKVFGDITFLNNEKGCEAKAFINDENYIFDIRCAIVTDIDTNEIIIKRIFTWDVIPNII